MEGGGIWKRVSKQVSRQYSCYEEVTVGVPGPGLTFTKTRTTSGSRERILRVHQGCEGLETVSVKMRPGLGISDILARAVQPCEKVTQYLPDPVLRQMRNSFNFHNGHVQA